MPVVGQPPDAAVAHDLVELVLIDPLAQVGARPDHCDSWMMPRYMSVMYIVPSGAVVTSTGRNSGSVERMNSDSG